MKPNIVGLAVAGIAALGVGIALAATNPGQAAYEIYATRRLTEYLTENVCPQAPQVLGINIREGCAEAIQQNQEQLRQFIAESTERHNFGLFSIYQTTLSLEELVPGGLAQLLPETLLPSYEFQTVGVLTQFMTFKAELSQQ